MRNISHLLMFSRWYARWNFNSVLMANARVSTVPKERGDKRGRMANEEKMQKGSKRKKGAAKMPMTVRTCRRVAM